MDPKEEPELRELDEDQDAEDGVAIGQDEVPDVREDSVSFYEGEQLAGNPPTDAVTEG